MRLSRVFTAISGLLGVAGIIATVGAAAQTPRVLLLVASQGKTPAENAVLFVDPAARKVLYRVPVGGQGQPHNVAVSPDGRFAFTTDLVRGTQFVNYPGTEKNSASPLPSDDISIIDIAAHKTLYRVDVGPGAEPHGIGFGGGKVFFTAEGYKCIGRVDPVYRRMDWMAGIGQNRVHELVVTRDGTRIFSGNIGSDTVAAVAPWDPAIDVQTYSKGEQPPPWNTTLIPVGRGSEALAMSPDEKEVWILNRADATASIIDVATKKVIQTLDLKTKDPLRVAFTPDGSRVLISDAKSGEVLVLDHASRKEIKRIPNVGLQAHGLVVSPDGAYAYVGVQGSAEVVIIDMKTLEIAGRIPLGTGTKPFDGIDGMTIVQTR